jgi:hypothetical protein
VRARAASRHPQPPRERGQSHLVAAAGNDRLAPAGEARREVPPGSDPPAARSGCWRCRRRRRGGGPLELGGVAAPTPAIGASSSSSTSRTLTTASRPCVEEGEHLDTARRIPRPSAAAGRAMPAVVRWRPAGWGLFVPPARWPLLRARRRRRGGGGARRAGEVEGPPAAPESSSSSRSSRPRHRI